MNPLISVIMCTYNHSEYVQDAIESVVKQTYKDWELIIIDNGSTDDTQKILQKYNDNPKVRIVSYEKNDFITKRINEGVRLANGDFISILFSDDYYLPEIF